MMDELITAVSARTGLSQDQAKEAVDAVVGLLKTRLPTPLASSLDALVCGTGTEDAANQAGAGGSVAGEAEALLGNLFRNKS